MDHADITARIDRRLAKRRPEVNDKHIAQWDRQTRPGNTFTAYARDVDVRHGRGYAKHRR